MLIVYKYPHLTVLHVFIGVKKSNKPDIIACPVSYNLLFILNKCFFCFL